jgi:precorrin-6x reductase
MLNDFPPQRVVGRMQTPAPCATCGAMTEIAIYTLVSKASGEYAKEAKCDACILTTAPIAGTEAPTAMI